MGNWETVDNIEYATKRINIDKWQGYDFEHPSSEKDSFHLFFDITNSRFLHHTQNHYPGGYLFDTYRLGRDSTYYVYDGIGSRTGRDLLNLGSTSFNSRKNALLNNLPYFILKQLLSEVKNESILADEKDWIVLKKGPNSSEEYRLDKKTSLLKKVTKIQGKDVTVQNFEDYSPIDGLMMARKSSLERNGTLVYSDSLTLFKYNQKSMDPAFDFPNGYKSTAESTPKLSAKAITKDTYLIKNVDGDRNILFVNMGTYIVLTEAPLSSAVTHSILDVVHATLPGIPIKYVHLSHFHNDHIAGIAELVKEGATIICTNDMKQPIMSLLQDTKADFLILHHHKTLEENQKKMEFFEVPNSHAKGMSFLYLPKEKLIYQGDLLSLPTDSYLTPAIPVTREFADFTHKEKIHFTKIIGHHGLPIIPKNTFDEILNMKKTSPLFKNTFEH